MNEKDYIIIDNEEYIIVDELDYNNEHYIYVINDNDKEKKVSILKETMENGKKYIESVPKSKMELIMNLFAKRFLEKKRTNYN